MVIADGVINVKSPTKKGVVPLHKVFIITRFVIIQFVCTFYTLGSLLNVQYVKQFRPPILRSYCTFNRDIWKILKPVRLIETYTFRFKICYEAYTFIRGLYE